MALLIVLTPQWLLYQGEIWKDMLFADAAIAGFAALAWLREAAAFAGLVRSWRCCCWLWRRRCGRTGWCCCRWRRVTLALIAPGKRWLAGPGLSGRGRGAGLGVSLALAARSDGGDGAAAEMRLGQSYDLAGALAREPDLSLPSWRRTTRIWTRLLRGRGARLYTPLRNDPFAADPAINQALWRCAGRRDCRAWKALVLDHPLLYLRVRWRISARC